MKNILVCFIAAFLVQSVFAINVRGATSCGDWVQERQLKGSTTRQTWVVGYLSGLAVGSEVDFIGKKDNPSLFLWIDNYCRANPLKDIDDAANELALELIKSKGR